MLKEEHSQRRIDHSSSASQKKVPHLNFHQVTASVQQSIVKIAVIGDIHDLWDLEDNAALKHLNVDLALFVGDYGNEAVEVVRRIAAVDLPKAAVMGNHDAYYSASNKGIKNCPYDRTREDWVQLQMDLLGEAHIGFSKREFPQFVLTIVGGRPFSWGGSKWRHGKFYRDRFDVRNFDDSVERILDAADEAEHPTVIFLGHVGPYGLGDQPNDICGKDWGKNGGGGDYGDPDFARALALTQEVGKRVPLVTFGRNRSFSVVTLIAGIVESITLIWLNAHFEQISEESLYQRD